MRRAAVLLVSAVAVLAVLSPLLRSSDYDSYPISSYPMFARDRGRVVTITTAVAVDARGDLHYLSPELLADTAQPVQAAVTVQRAVGAGSENELCNEIADRLDSDTVVAVEVTTGSYDVIAWFDGDETPLDRTVHARCDVPA